MLRSKGLSLFARTLKQGIEGAGVVPVCQVGVLSCCDDLFARNDYRSKHRFAMCSDDLTFRYFLGPCPRLRVCIQAQLQSAVMPRRQSAVGLG